MVESSDLQSAIQRTQAMERIQQLQSQQEELNRKRFELEMARHRAEKARRVPGAEKTESKKVVRDKYEGGEHRDGRKKPQGDEKKREQDPGQGPALGGNLDVRI